MLHLATHAGADQVPVIPAVAAHRIVAQRLDHDLGFVAGQFALICQRLNPKRRRRSNPRVVKRKYVKWHVKRAHHADWPQPTRRPDAVVIGGPQAARP